jgi:general secretion pathway protein G
MRARSVAIVAVALATVLGCDVCDWKKSDRAMLDIGSVASALKVHYGKFGRYPSTEEGLQALVDRHILDAVPMDPWGNRYQYALWDGEIEIRSWGADSRRGGSGEDADLDLRDLRSRLDAGR